MTHVQSDPIPLTRDCRAVLIPSGQRVVLSKGSPVLIVKTLGGSFTVQAAGGWLARIDRDDADALGVDAPDAESATTSPSEQAASFDLAVVTDALRGVFDPEIPINVVDLGLIYGCDAHELSPGEWRVEIKMSMTAPGCGMGDVLKADAEALVGALPGVAEVDVELVWDPPWTIAHMSEAARLQLGLY